MYATDPFVVAVIEITLVFLGGYAFNQDRERRLKANDSGFTVEIVRAVFLWQLYTRFMALPLIPRHTLSDIYPT